MKRRKPPFILITLLALCLGVVVFFGLNFAKMVSGNPNPAPTPPESPIGQTRKAPSKESLAGNKSTKLAEPSADESAGPPGMPDEPTVLVRKASNTKPKPSESSTDSGWYTSEYGPARKK